MRNQLAVNLKLMNSSKHFSESIKKLYETINLILNREHLHKATELSISIHDANLTLLELIEHNAYFHDLYLKHSYLRQFVFGTVDLLLRNQSIFYHKFDVIAACEKLFKYDIRLEKCEFVSECNRSDCKNFFLNLKPYLWKEFLEQLEPASQIRPNPVHLHAFMRFLCYFFFSLNYNDVSDIFSRIFDIAIEQLVSPLTLSELILAFAVNVCNYFDHDEARRSVESNFEENYLSNFVKVYSNCNLLFQTNLSNKKCRLVLKQALTISLKFYSAQLGSFFKIINKNDIENDAMVKKYENKLKWFESFYLNENIITMCNPYFRDLSQSTFDKEIMMDYHFLTNEYLKIIANLKYSDLDVLKDLSEKSKEIFIGSFDILETILASADFTPREKREMSCVTFDLIYELNEFLEYKFWQQVWIRHESVMRNGLLNWHAPALKLVAEFCRVNRSEEYQYLMCRIGETLLESWRVKLDKTSAQFNGEHVLSIGPFLDAVLQLVLARIDFLNTDLDYEERFKRPFLLLLNIVQMLFEANTLDSEKWSLFCDFYSKLFSVRPKAFKILTDLCEICYFVVQKVFICLKFQDKFEPRKHNEKDLLKNLTSFLLDNKQIFVNKNDLIKCENMLSILNELDQSSYTFF